MLRHNLLLIYRNFKRFKSTFFINLIGLSTGLACTLLIYLWVNDELTIDKFHKNDDRIFHAMEHRVKSDGIWTSFSTPGILAEALIEEMPEVEYACGSSWPQPATLSVGEKVMKVKGRYSGKDFFRIFSYDIIQGNTDKLLADKNSMVISESLALKLFNTTVNVLGKVVEFEHAEQFVITGIFKDVPAHSSEEFEFVLPFEKYKEDNARWILYWGNTGSATYVLLKKGVNADDVNKKIADYIKVKTNNEITYRTLFLKKYSDIYLQGEYKNGALAGGRMTYVKLFSLIAVFILVIACINFMNLSTAKASRRIREVGIKKAIGAGRKVLILQYMGESVLMSFLSMVLAVLMVDIFLDQFNAITGKQLTLQFNSTLVLAFVSVSFFTGLLAGSYPALYLSGFNPATVLKGKFSPSGGELWVRKGLVVFQFALSIILIVSVVVVYKQIEFVQSTNLGYEKENILYFYREGKVHDRQSMDVLLSEFKSIPGVINASSISHDMTGHNSGTNGLKWPGKDPEDMTEFENVTVNYDVMETLGIQLAAGRMFSRNFPADTTKIIINETGIEYMGLKDPIGATVKLWGMDMEIIGVAKDFHYESLRENLKPVFFRLSPSNTWIIMVKLAGGKQAETVDKLKDLYQKFNPGFTFDYKFLDTEYLSQYMAEQRVATLSRYFAGLAILISCLGLFGLASFTAERRLKEIGIRKVLGSTVMGIVYLLSGEFTKIVFVSIIIALPVSFFFTRLWLENFAFRIPLEWWYFIGAGMMALVIARVTVGTQAFKAARVNPTRCLKDE
jgi:putative ABC transport system permease protein